MNYYFINNLFHLFERVKSVNKKIIKKESTFFFKKKFNMFITAYMSEI